MNVVIVYHSGYGHTEVMADAVARGAGQVPGVEAGTVKIDGAGKIPDSSWVKLEEAQAIVFGCPTYMGSCSGQFKMFADATSKVWAKRQWKDKIAGGFTNSGNYSGDKLSTLLQLAILAAQHGMIWVGNTELPSGKTPDDVNRISSYTGVMAQSDHQSPPDVAPPSGDIKTGEIYGKRIAEAVKRWHGLK